MIKFVTIFTVLVIYSLVLIIKPSLQHAGHGKQPDPKKPGDPKKPHQFGDIDKQHIKSHMNEMGVADDEDLDEARMVFYHFKFHDVNNDSLIDGLEIYRVTHEEEFDAMYEEHHYLLEDEVTATVDLYMKRADLNNDGYIDYHEYKKNSHFFIS